MTCLCMQNLENGSVSNLEIVECGVMKSTCPMEARRINLEN